MSLQRYATAQMDGNAEIPTSPEVQQADLSSEEWLKRIRQLVKWKPRLWWGAVLSVDLVLSAVAFALGTVLGSVVLGWLRLRTGSIWPGTLFHAAHNTAIGSATLTTLTYAMTGRGSDWSWISWVLYFIPVAALCVWILLTGQLGYQGSSEDGEGH